MQDLAQMEKREEEEEEGGGQEEVKEALVTIWTLITDW